MTLKNSQWLQISNRLRSSFELWVWSLLLFSIFRAIFYLLFYRHAEAFTANETTTAFLLGLRFDIRVATLLILPMFILALPKRSHWLANSKNQNIWVLSYTAVYTFIIAIYGVDFGYYAYLQSRINITVLQFLRNPLISLEMVHQTYNLFLIVPLSAALVWALYCFFSRLIFGRSPRHLKNDPLHKPKTMATQSVTISLIIFVALYGSISQYPLRWSEAFFSQNMFVAYLSMNPVHYFVDSAESRRQTYDEARVKEHYDDVAKYLGVRDLHNLNFRRPVDITEKFKLKNSHPNIVYIVMESMAAYKTGVFKNANDTSPALDRLANAGWLFRNYYTPTEGTARSLFCVLTGIPDINAKSSSSRNPLIVNQNTLINALEGYEKYYFIGGSANWGNIRGVYMNNIKGLKMYEGDSNLEGPRTDVWGLSDLDLFRASARELSKRDPSKPFFALIQSASFHRPYTIPADHGRFVEKHLSPEELSTLGFASNEEYNSFRLADYSLGEFFKLIENTEFYKNTIFIIHGDHGLPHNGAANVSEGYKFYGLNRFHVPLVFFSPLIEKHEEFNVMMSETDVWPTVLGAIGYTFTNAALGRNVFAIKENEPHYAFSYVYYSEPLQIMLYDQNYIAFGTERGIEGLYRYGGWDASLDGKVDFKNNLKDIEKEKFNSMSKLLTGIFETSRYMLYHNPRLTAGPE